MLVVETLELRRLLSVTPTITGSVVDAYRLADGTVAHVALADRTVYLDANQNTRLDAGESSTTTNLSGAFRLSAPVGTSTVRLVELPGWSAAGIDSTTVTAARGASVQASTFSTRMTHPTRVDVLAAYTASARDGKSDAATVAQVRSLFLAANQVYANSDTNVILNNVAIVSTSYRESGSIDDDLDAVSDGDGSLSGIAGLRASDHADIVTLFYQRREDAWRFHRRRLGVRPLRPQARGKWF